MDEIAVRANATEFCTRDGTNAWFTSLWTLQEACLRPDMLICNEQWEVLTVTAGVPLSLSDIVALVQSAAPISESKKRVQVPGGVERIWKMLHESGMRELVTLSRASIIGLGDRRECSHRRAEAIMSAIGTCRWFNTSARSPRPEQLVVDACVPRGNS